MIGIWVLRIFLKSLYNWHFRINLQCQISCTLKITFLSTFIYLPCSIKSLWAEHLILHVAAGADAEKINDSCPNKCYCWGLVHDSKDILGCRTDDKWKSTIVHFKRLGSRHFVKEMKTQSILLKYNMIFRKTKLKPFLKYIQRVSNHTVYLIPFIPNLMRLKVRQCTFVANIISLTACFNRGVHPFCNDLDLHWMSFKWTMPNRLQ